MYCYKNIVAILLLFLLTTSANAQDSCYTCNRDSLIAQLPLAKNAAHKITLLTLIIDFAPTADSANKFITQLIAENDKQKVIDIEPYRKLQHGNVLYLNKEYSKALLAYQEAVELFDRKKKKVVNLLLGFRNLFNLLNIQEERYKYYKAKLDYYLLNGPLENTAACYHGVGGYYVYTADYNQAISYYLRDADVFKKFYPYWHYNALGIIGIYYANWGNLNRGLEYLTYALGNLKALQRQSPFTEKTFAYYEQALSEIKLEQKNYDEALQHSEAIIDYYKHDTTDRFYAIGLLMKALVFIHTDKVSAAYPLLSRAKMISDSFFNGRMTTYNSTLEIDFGLYQYYARIKNYWNAEKYLLRAYKRAVEEKSSAFQLKYLKQISDFYLNANKIVAAKTYTLAYFKLKEETDAAQNSFKVAQYENEKKQFDQLENINKLKQERVIQQAAISKRNTVLLISFSAIVLIGIATIFIYRQLQINKKNLHILKTTQAQLIQSEKMASLGELTAGIAHEIQNPLNFVNNFSDVNTELIEELKNELLAENKQEALSLADDIRDNEQKINDHGKRADAIVKGMLQHSRASTGKKEPTDVNTLADEYLRLSYHGLKAKDKDFNVVLRTNFDEGIGKIEIVPEDIGRVLLNLYNNAFYAVNEKNKQLNGTFEPTVEVSTKKHDGKIEIHVKDNGTGIPQKVVDKIFQPFFTTKPTGQGTGLGLSLSYDIIKAHGGELKVKPKEGEGAVFAIILPS